MMKIKIAAIMLTIACLLTPTALAGGGGGEPEVPSTPYTPYDGSSQAIETQTVITIGANAGDESMSGEKVTTENIAVTQKTPEQIEKENQENLLNKIINHLSGSGNSSDSIILENLGSGIMSGEPSFDLDWDVDFELDNVGDWIEGNKTITINGIDYKLNVFGPSNEGDNVVNTPYEKPEDGGSSTDKESLIDKGFITIGNTGTSGGKVEIGTGHIGVLVGQSKLEDVLDKTPDDFSVDTGDSTDDETEGDDTGIDTGWFTYEIVGVPYEIQFDIKQWMQGDTPDSKEDGHYGNNNSTGFGKNEYIPGTNIEVTVTDNKTKFELLMKYWEELKKNGGSQNIQFAKYTIYETTGFSEQTIRYSVPQNQYRWCVTGANGSSIEDNTTTPYTRILFRAAGTYQVQVFNTQSVTRNNKINGNKYDIWVLADGSAYDGLVLHSEKSSFEVYVSENIGPTIEEVELHEDGLTANVTKQMVNVMQLIDKDGNVRAPATDFTTERTDTPIGG